jgi:hypothetical protein
MDFEHSCRIIDTVTDLSVHDKTALLRDLARRAALVLNVDDDIVFHALLKREDSDRPASAMGWRFRTCGWSK